jgi:hypothetical protein
MWKSGEIVSATVMPEQPATRDQSGDRQQQDEADGHADRQRRDIAQHRLRDHRQHQADDDPLARRKPRRPTRGQAQAEDQAARNQR